MEFLIWLPPRSPQTEMATPLKAGFGSSHIGLQPNSPKTPSAETVCAYLMTCNMIGRLIHFVILLVIIPHTHSCPPTPPFFLNPTNSSLIFTSHTHTHTLYFKYRFPSQLRLSSSRIRVKSNKPINKIISDRLSLLVNK